MNTKRIILAVLIVILAAFAISQSTPKTESRAGRNTSSFVSINRDVARIDEPVPWEPASTATRDSFPWYDNTTFKSSPYAPKDDKGGSKRSDAPATPSAGKAVRD